MILVPNFGFFLSFVAFCMYCYLFYWLFVKLPRQEKIDMLKKQKRESANANIDITKVEKADNIEITITFK